MNVKVEKPPMIGGNKPIHIDLGVTGRGMVQEVKTAYSLLRQRRSGRDVLAVLDPTRSEGAEQAG